MSFDFDGTLVDSNETKRRLFFEIAKPYDPDGSIVKKIFESPSPGDRFSITRTMAARFLEDTDSEAIDALARELANTYSERCEVEVIGCDEITGARPALEELSSRGLPLFINTSTPRAAVLPILLGRKIDHFFAGVYGSDAGKLENLRSIAEQTRCQPDELVSVGDGEDDRRAAIVFGCAFVGIAIDDRGRFDRTPETQLADLTTLPSVLEPLDPSPT